MRGSPLPFRLINRTGYDSGDLRRFFQRALRATNTRIRGLVIFVSSIPSRTRGCADIGGRRMSIALAPPSLLSVRRLARVTIHEIAHLRGLSHGDMPPLLLYSPDRGEMPAWARGARLRWHGRAPGQLRTLRQDRLTRR